MESGRPKDGVLPASCPGGTSTRHQGGGLQTNRILADSIESFSLLVSMGISTFTSKEFVIFCRVSKIGHVLGFKYVEMGTMLASKAKVGKFDDSSDKMVLCCNSVLGCTGAPYLAQNFKPAKQHGILD